MLFEAPDPLPEPTDTAAWRRLLRQSEALREPLLRSGWRCTDPADGVRTTELWVSADGEQTQVLVVRPPVWSLPPEDERPEPGSDDWLRLVTRSHRERDLMRRLPGGGASVGGRRTRSRCGST